MNETDGEKRRNFLVKMASAVGYGAFGVMASEPPTSPLESNHVICARTFHVQRLVLANHSILSA